MGISCPPNPSCNKIEFRMAVTTSLKIICPKYNMVYFLKCVHPNLDEDREQLFALLAVLHSSGNTQDFLS